MKNSEPTAQASQQDAVHTVDANSAAKAPARWQAKYWFAVALVLCTLAVTLNLGFWQLRRAAAKEAWAAQELAAAKLPALSNGELLQIQTAPAYSGSQRSTTATDTVKPDATPALNSRKARVTGVWLHEWTYFLENRPHPEGKAGASGYIVVTPLRLALSGEAGDTLSTSVLLVQRGWLPRGSHRLSPNDLPKLSEPQASSPQVEGTLSPQVSRVWQPNLPNSGQSYAVLTAKVPQSASLAINYPVTGLQAQLSGQGLVLLPTALQQASPSLTASLANLGTGAVGSSATQVTPLLQTWPKPSYGIDKHYGYAFQWFALSAVGAVLSLYWGVYRGFWARRKRSSAAAQ